MRVDRGCAPAHRRSSRSRARPRGDGERPHRHRHRTGASPLPRRDGPIPRHLRRASTSARARIAPRPIAAHRARQPLRLHRRVLQRQRHPDPASPGPGAARFPHDPPRAPRVCRWVSRRRVEEADVYTADANNGCVNRIRSPSSETSPESIAGFSVPSVPGPSPDAAARSATVGRAAAAVVRSIWRVGSGNADIRSTRRSRTSSGRGRVSPTSGGPLRVSSRAISSAKNGFPLAAS